MWQLPSHPWKTGIRNSNASFHVPGQKENQRVAFWSSAGEVQHGAVGNTWLPLPVRPHEEAPSPFSSHPPPHSMDCFIPQVDFRMNKKVETSWRLFKSHALFRYKIHNPEFKKNSYSGCHHWGQ